MRIGAKGIRAITFRLEGSTIASVLSVLASTNKAVDGVGSALRTVDARRPPRRSTAPVLPVIDFKYNWEVASVNTILSGNLCLAADSGRPGAGRAARHLLLARGGPRQSFCSQRDHACSQRARNLPPRHGPAPGIRRPLLAVRGRPAGQCDRSRSEPLAGLGAGRRSHASVSNPAARLRSFRARGVAPLPDTHRRADRRSAHFPVHGGRAAGAVPRDAPASRGMERRHRACSHRRSAHLLRRQRRSSGRVADPCGPIARLALRSQRHALPRLLLAASRRQRLRCRRIRSRDREAGTRSCRTIRSGALAGVLVSIAGRRVWRARALRFAHPRRAVRDSGRQSVCAT